MRLTIPIEYETLANGLRVVLSPDRAAPIVTVAVYYNVGMRLEPRGRTGFAHLFEHLMFQGSSNLGKMEFVRLVQESGGVLNGTTRNDVTNYFEVLPANALELALWMEADRMRGPAITEAELDNQRDVVKNEIRVNVLNRPYGSFPWIDMPERAFTNWHNSHNGYGEMADLDAASLADVRAFFETYYSPANAVLVVVGDLEPPNALAMVRRYFQDIPSAPVPPLPDLSEPRQDSERRFSKTDPLAARPALAVSYHTPPRDSAQYLALGVLDQVLVVGDDSLLYRDLVARRGITGAVDGGINFLGNMFGAATPLLWSSWLIHDAGTSSEAVLEAIDDVIESVRAGPLDDGPFQRALVKSRSWYYDLIGGGDGLSGHYPGFGLADLLASFTIFDGDPARVHDVARQFNEVTPSMVAATAREYLRRENRTVLSVEPGGAD